VLPQKYCLRVRGEGFVPPLELLEHTCLDKLAAKLHTVWPTRSVESLEFCILTTYYLLLAIYDLLLTTCYLRLTTYYFVSKERREPRVLHPGCG
jgi:hypothetical protein